MGDPVLDEDLMVDLIEVDPTPDAAQRLMAGAMMLLVDAYDRKVTRENFNAIVTTAVALHGYAAQYGCLCVTQRLFRDGKLDDLTLTNSVETLRKFVVRNAEIGAKQARLLRDCPLSDDKVH